jgi:hypothetical protein
VTSFGSALLLQQLIYVDPCMCTYVMPFQNCRVLHEDLHSVLTRFAVPEQLYRIGHICK